MMKARPLLSEEGNTIEVGAIIGYHIMCEGCGSTHFIYTNTKFCSNGGWGFNGDTEKPTFTPSLLCTWPPTTKVCHSFITDGKIKYLSDCTHKLAGQTIDLPEIE